MKSLQGLGDVAIGLEDFQQAGQYFRQALKLANTMDVDLNQHQFAQTSDLAPVATNRDGIYVCGVFQGPKDIPQSVMEASAASSAAAKNLAEPLTGTPGSRYFRRCHLSPYQAMKITY